ncbi:MAG TPA: hypothetical protein VK878_01205 [Candidatus Deferrimicrobiaceae bacterium]|nr:hypothetical protein [Candidatus Deferrimicrobiaceae bacterium]
MLLGLKDEDETHDDAPLPEPYDPLTAEDAFPDDGIDADETDDRQEHDGLLSSVPGPLIAAATFVPAFLAVFFGLSYVLGGATPARMSDAPAPAVTAPGLSDAGERATPSLSETIRDPFAPPGLLDPPATSFRNPGEVGRRDDPRDTPRESTGEDAAPPAAAPSTPPSELALPPASPPAAESHAPRAARAPEPPRQTRAAAPTPAPEPPAPTEPQKNGREWTPAAAFTDREAASRLASSIQQQGYPVEIRQDRSSTRPWVVWMGAQPRGGDRRR